MNCIRTRVLVALACATVASPAIAADYPAAKQGEWIARDFKFHTGEVMSEMRLAYRTVGEPSGEPVVVLHGTSGSSAAMLTPAFAGEMFGAGQPLDAKKYFIIIPDSIGHGGSAKPSDGLRTKFPRYNYDDMVAAQHRLLTEHLGIRHVRMMIGNSMGGMHVWTWATTYPDYADAWVPMASQPTAMASRNWMLRRLMIETVRRDPAYNGGNYTQQPPSLRIANVFYAVATAGGTLAFQKAAPTSAAGDKIVEARLAAAPPPDANDFIFQWESSRDFDVAAKLDRIGAPLLAINAADDERNPPETGLMVKAMEKVKNGRLLLIPASEQTTGHGTTANAGFYAKEVGDLVQSAPRRAM
jgi:homoserine O-acetyltransferase/O-succinyltransferase